MSFWLSQCEVAIGGIAQRSESWLLQASEEDVSNNIGW